MSLGGKKLREPFVPGGVVDDNEPVRKWSQRQEKRFADKIGFDLTPNSGATPMPGAKGDGQDSQHVWEHKGTKDRRIVVDSSVVGKVCREAAKAGKSPRITLVLMRNLSRTSPRELL